MLPSMDHNRAVASKRSRASSSFDQWLERAQRSGASFVDPNSVRYNSLDWQASHAAHTRSPAPSSQSRPGPYSQLDESEGLMFMQAHYNHLLVPPGAAAISVPASAAAPASFAYGGLHDGSFAVPAGLSTAGPLSADMAPWGLHEPYDISQVLASRRARTGEGGAALAATSAEAEQYIARLEEEVQVLMSEVADRDRRIVATSAVTDAVALQLEEQRRRADLVVEEGSARLGQGHAWLRTVTFQRTLEERARAMELNTQLSVLKHELKVSEAMLAQTQSSAATAATQQQQQLMLLTQRSEEDGGITRSVTATVRTLLQEEYGRLAELVAAEMPKKPPSAATAVASVDGAGSVGSEAGSAGTAVEQRRLEQLLESLIAGRLVAPAPPSAPAVSAQASSSTSPSPLPSMLGDGDAAQLVRLAHRVCRHHTALLDLYAAEADRKAAVAQYESDLARLIHEKQGALTWAALYQDRKDEVKHLSEQLMSLRGELRAARAQTGRGVGGGPSAASVAGSTMSTQSYEAYAAPYVPASVRSPRQASDRLEASSASAAQQRPRAARAARKPIGELREEARRLGALPASHVPPLVTSRSPSMDSFSAVSSPGAGEAVMLMSASGQPARAIPVTVPPPPPVPLAAAPAAALPTQAPAVPAIRTFAPKLAGGESSNSSSSTASSEPRVRGAAATIDASAGRRRSGARQTAARAAEPVVLAAARNRAPSTSSSSTASSEVLPATGAQLMKSALRRVSAVTANGTTAASPATAPAAAAARSPSAATSVSSVAATSGTSSLSRAAARWSATNGALKATSTKAAAVHNSFDDDGDEDDGRAAAAGRSGRGGGKGSVVSTTRGSTTAPVAAATPAPTTKVPVFKAGLSGTTSSAAAAPLRSLRETADVRSDGDDDDDTSSVSLSMTSLSSAAPPARPRVASGKKTKEASPKARHARKSSFDDDDASGGGGGGGSGGGGGDCSTSSSSAPAAPRPAVRGSTATAPAKAVAAPAKAPSTTLAPGAAVKPTATPAKTTTAAPATAARPSKLKLPSW